MPADSQSFSRAAVSVQPDVVMADDAVPRRPPANDPSADHCRDASGSASMPLLGEGRIDERPSTSSGVSGKSAAAGPRTLLFKVHYCDKVIPVEVPDTGTVGELNLLLGERRCLPNLATV